VQTSATAFYGWVAFLISQVLTDAINGKENLLCSTIYIKNVLSSGFGT